MCILRSLCVNLTVCNIEKFFSITWGELLLIIISFLMCLVDVVRRFTVNKVYEKTVVWFPLNISYLTLLQRQKIKSPKHLTSVGILLFFTRLVRAVWKSRGHRDGRLPRLLLAFLRDQYYKPFCRHAHKWLDTNSWSSMTSVRCNHSANCAVPICAGLWMPFQGKVWLHGWWPPVWLVASIEINIRFTFWSNPNQ